MSAQLLDVLIFIPIIPAIPVIITWWLPWEDWVPKHISKSIIGPYLLYCSFAAWHFEMPGWFIVLLGVWGIVVSGMAIPERAEKRRRMAGGLILTESAPALVVTIRQPNGTPLRAICPLCEAAFSTEAFDADPNYPHEQKLKEWYLQHFSVVHAGQKESAAG